MAKQSKTFVADLAVSSAKSELPAYPSPDSHDYTLQSSPPDKNVPNPVSLEEFAEDPKCSKKIQHTQNTQSTKKSISHWKRFKRWATILSIISALAAFANHSVQLWQNLDMSNRIGALLNNLPSVEQVKPDSKLDTRNRIGVLLNNLPSVEQVKPDSQKVN